MQVEPRVRLADLMDAGLLAPNTQFVWRRQREYRGITHKAKLTAAGRIELSGGKTYPTPSAAARVLNDDRPVNGWVVWKVGNERGPSLADVRKQLQQD